MAQPPRVEQNRFRSLLNTKWKRRGFFCALLAICFLLLEIVAVGLTIAFSYFNGRSLEPIKSQFLIARPFFDNPVNKFTNAEYVGHLPTPSALRRWNIADPILGWRNGTNVGTTNAHGYAEGVEWRATNPQGFFSAGELNFNVVPQKPPGVFRIFILGGSTVAGYGVETPLRNLPTKFSETLKRHLNGKAGFGRLEVINAGVDGYFSINEYLYFATELIHYDPDLVIFYDGWNDYLFWDQNPDFAKRSSQHTKLQQQLNDSYTVSGSARHFARSLVAPFIDLRFQSASLWIPTRLIDKVFVDRSLTIAEGGGFDINNNVVQRPLSQDAKKSMKARALYETNIRDEIALAMARGINVAYFLQPLLGVSEKKPDGYENEWLQFNKTDVAQRRDFYEDIRHRLKTIAAEYQSLSGVCIRDLSRATDNESSRVFSDSGHLNEKGNSIVAASMVNALVECSMF